MGRLTHTVSGGYASFLSADIKPITSLKVNFLPTLTGSGNPSPTNIRPLAGWNTIYCWVAGLNMLDSSSMSNGTSNGLTYTKHVNANNQVDYITVVGKTDNKNCFRNLNYNLTIKYNIPDGYLAFNSYSDQINVIPIGNPDGWGDVDGNGIYSYPDAGVRYFNVAKGSKNYTWVRTLSFPSSTNVDIDTKVYPMMYNPNDVGCAFEPFDGTRYNVSWASQGDIYGGYVDLITGEVVATYKTITYIGAEEENWHDGTYSNYPRFFIRCDDAKGTSNRSYIASNIGIYNSSGHAEGTIFAYKSDHPYFYYYPPNTITTVSDFKTWLASNNLLIVYELETPVVITTLTSKQLNTRIGRNNIFSNTNADTEVTYEFEDWLSKKRMALLNDKFFIPPTYQKCDYLQGSGGKSRVDTGVSGDDTTLRIQTEFAVVSMNENYSPVFANYKDESDSYVWRCILPKLSSYPNNDLLYVTCGNVAPSGTKGNTRPIYPCGSGNSVINQKVYLDMTYGRCYYRSGNVSGTATSTTKECDANTKNITIGALSSGSTGYTSPIKFYSFKMYSQGNMIRNYIPVVRKSDNKAGFYDTINHTFNPSIGTVDFIAGNDS